MDGGKGKEALLTDLMTDSVTGSPRLAGLSFSEYVSSDSLKHDVHGYISGIDVHNQP